MCWTSAGYWVRHIRYGAPVSMRARLSRYQPSPERTARFVPSASRLFRVPSLSLPPGPFRDQDHCQGFVPLRDITGASPLIARVPKSLLRSVRRCSQPLDGFLRAPTCGPVSSRSRVQGLQYDSFRGFGSLPQPPFLFGRRLPPCRWLTDRSLD